MTWFPLFSISATSNPPPSSGLWCVLGWEATLPCNRKMRGQESAGSSFFLPGRRARQGVQRAYAFLAPAPYKWNWGSEVTPGIPFLVPCCLFGEGEINGIREPRLPPPFPLKVAGMPSSELSDVRHVHCVRDSLRRK